MVQGIAIEDGCIVDVNPATGEVIANVPCSTPEEIDAVVAAAATAQPAWAALPISERVALLKTALASLATDVEGLAQMITLEMGKVITEVRARAKSVRGLRLDGLPSAGLRFVCLAIPDARAHAHTVYHRRRTHTPRPAPPARAVVVAPSSNIHALSHRSGEKYDSNAAV